LDGEGGVFQEAEVFHQHGIIEVDQDTGTLAFLGLENRAQKAG
jgi:hypothetical protein